ncbi:hypothetical protein A9798_01085 [Edwardsiella hoshinae]|uniref:Uncharacterized protein n=1 Tax=Edwardsiella hoshinae TaxID=93378 RepID=A0A376D799_9GAMM|nr:hypothetical protein A9798_01085 [Edwardsiella hoshinae]STC83144.1 Uncharacterised protein [Edwardsiella hoshinae]
MMRGYGLVIWLFPCLVIAARDPFVAPRRVPNAIATVSAVGLVGDARCITWWQRDAQGRWHPALTRHSPRKAPPSSAGQRFIFRAWPNYPFNCPSRSARRAGEGL